MSNLANFLRIGLAPDCVGWLPALLDPGIESDIGAETVVRESAEGRSPPKLRASSGARLVGNDDEVEDGAVDAEAEGNRNGVADDREVVV